MKPTSEPCGFCHGDFAFRRLLKTGAEWLRPGQEMCYGVSHQHRVFLSMMAVGRPHFHNTLLLILCVKILFIKDSLPHSDNPRRHSLPSPWADIPALKPPWARRPPLPEKSHKEMLLRDFLMVNTSPPNTGDSPHLGKKWLQGAALWREWYPRAPRRKDNSEMLSLIPSAAGQTLPSERWGSETSLPESFRDNSCLEREPAQD